MNFNDTASQNCATYCFKPNKLIAKKQVSEVFIGFGIFFVVILAYLFFFSKEPKLMLDKLMDDYVFYLFIFAYPLFNTVIILFLFNRQQIDINRQEIIFKGRFIPKVPKRVSWGEIDAIYKTENQPTRWGRSTQPIRLIFMLKSGEGFTLAVNNLAHDIFVDVDRAVDLITVLELYDKKVCLADSIVEQEGRKRIKSFAQPYNVDLGAKAGDVAFVSLILMIVCVTLLFLSPAYALESATLPLILWSVAIVAALIACWYMCSIDNKIVMLLLAALFAGVIVFLMLPITANIPVLFGDKSRETFSISEENETKQIWHSELSPTLTLIFHHEIKERRFHGKGTQQTFTVYRGPLGLNSIPDHEYKSLHPN